MSKIGNGGAQSPLKKMQYGSLFSVSSNMSTQAIRGIAFAPDDPAKMLIGGGNGNIELSTDYGNTFGANVTTPFGTSIINDFAFSTVTPGLVVAVTTDCKIAASADYGATWGSLITNPFAFATNGIQKIICDDFGIFHTVGDGGVYAQSTDATATAWTDAIDCGAGTVILDNVIAIGEKIIITGHSARARISTDRGATFSVITVPFAGTDALWAVESDGSRVVIGCYESGATERGKISISDDGGLTFSALLPTPFSENNIRLQRIIRNANDGTWHMVGDSGYYCWTYDFLTFNSVLSSPFRGGIIYKVAFSPFNAHLVGASGRQSRSLLIQ